jgi:hypothetical protein
MAACVRCGAEEGELSEVPSRGDPQDACDRCLGGVVAAELEQSRLALTAATAELDRATSKREAYEVYRDRVWERERITRVYHASYGGQREYETVLEDLKATPPIEAPVDVPSDKEVTALTASAQSIRKHVATLERIERSRRRLSRYKE